jgi:hypothetical protein
MRRTTIYLEPELEVLLKLEMQRAGRPMADIVREALRTHLTSQPRRVPPGAGAFSSGIGDTADRTEDALAETGFGTGPPSAPARRVPAAKKRR